jgi:hypothetical protein
MSDKKINDDFFGDILDENPEENSFNEEKNEDEMEFDFENVEPIEETKEPVETKNKRKKSEIQDSVEELQGSINSMLDTIDIRPDDFFPDKDLLPGLDIEIEHHDYEKDIELIKIESKETLECLANLYLSDDQMKTKNIYKIIKDDSISLSKLNFSIEQAQRALISCMKQLDSGVNDPLMYQSVALFQKEMRDTVKLAYELQRKMKDFYKELKSELAEINAGEEDIIDEEDNYTIVGDPKMLNDVFERMKNDPTFLEEMMEQSKKKKK